MTTYMAKPGEVERRWYLIDAGDKTLGRLASEIAKILRGKNKVQYTPHVDTGDFVVVINADRVVVTGNRADKKRYYHHTGYPGGLKEIPYREMMRRKPEEVLRMAVWGMLPKHRLGRKQLKKLKIYAGPEHPHEAQQPEPYEVS